MEAHGICLWSIPMPACELQITMSGGKFQCRFCLERKLTKSALSHHLKRCNVRPDKKAHQVATGLDIDQRTAEQVIPFVDHAPIPAVCSSTTGEMPKTMGAEASRLPTSSVSETSPALKKMGNKLKLQKHRFLRWKARQGNRRVINLAVKHLHGWVVKNPQFLWKSVPEIAKPLRASTKSSLPMEVFEAVVIAAKFFSSTAEHAGLAVNDAPLSPLFIGGNNNAAVNAAVNDPSPILPAPSCQQHGETAQNGASVEIEEVIVHVTQFSITPTEKDPPSNHELRMSSLTDQTS